MFLKYSSIEYSILEQVLCIFSTSAYRKILKLIEKSFQLR